VEAEAPVKTECDTVAGVEAYTDVATLNEVEAEALVYTGLIVSTSAVHKSYRHTDTLLVVEPETLGTH